VDASESAAEVYYSAWAGDAVMDALIALFVQELPHRTEALRRAAARGERGEVARLAHQLKGAGGSHGFPQLTLAAAAVERLACEGTSPVELLAALQRLSEACQGCRSG